LARAAGNLCLGISASTGGGANSLAKVYAGLIKGALPYGPINQTVTEKITTVCDGAKKNPFAGNWMIPDCSNIDHQASRGRITEAASSFGTRLNA
jgi:hypothetical protein